MAEEAIDLMCTSRLDFFEAVRIVTMTNDLRVTEKIALVNATHQKMIEKINK
jgi:hypothetical protein